LKKRLAITVAPVKAETLRKALLVIPKRLFFLFFKLFR